MSFSYNNETWTPKSSNEHAVDLLNNINTVLSSNGITNLLKALLTNAIWIVCLALGAVRASFDQILYRAQNSLNIEMCDDNQILNLLPIAGTELIEGSYSIVTISVTASSEGSCIVPAGSQLPYINGVLFETTEELTVLSEATGTVTAVCDTKGFIEVAVGQLNSFISNITNLQSVTNLAEALPGRSDETPSDAKKRLIDGKTIDNNVDGTIKALRTLAGVNSAQVFFNPSSTTNLILAGSITLLPRHAYIVILGASELIAQTYVERMTAETQGGETQIYTTLSDQDFEVNFDYATSQDAYIKIFIPHDLELTLSESNALKQVIISDQVNAFIGQVLTSKYINNLFKDFNSFEISGASVSLDGLSYSERATIDANKYPMFTAENIVIENL